MTSFSVSLSLRRPYDSKESMGVKHGHLLVKRNDETLEVYTDLEINRDAE